MEEAFFRTHRYLVEHINAPVRRTLMDEIDWNDRMIGIKGTRGVGKTTFLLQYAKEKFGADDHKCLFVNMNNFYFQGRGIADFAGDFVIKAFQNFVKFFVLQRYEKLFITHGSIINCFSIHSLLAMVLRS